MSTVEPSGDPDPVLARRARIANLVSLGKRVGYSLVLLAMALFFAGFVTGFTSLIVNAIVLCIIVFSLLLAPALVFDYGVKAAVREDREQGRPLE